MRLIFLSASICLTLASISQPSLSQTTSTTRIEKSVSLDVPYVPTPQAVVDRMLSLAQVKRGETVYDLGSGDGRIVVTAAKKHGAKAVGIDLDPIRVKEARENVERNGVEHLVTIREGNALKTQDLDKANVVTLYLLPSVNLQLRPQLQKLPVGTRIVSHDFDMGDWKPIKEETMTVDGRDHKIYMWRVGSNGQNSKQASTQN